MGPGAVNVAVVDAGPLIHLTEIGCLSLLRIFDTLHIPDAVWSETVGQGRVSQGDVLGLDIVQRHMVLDPQPEGGYTVTCPLLPELITEGDTVQEAVSNVADALAAILEAYEDLGRPVPPVLRQLATDTPLRLETAVAVP